MTTLRGLLSHYYEVRESMRAPKSSTPDPERLRLESITFDGNNGNPKGVSYRKEMNYALVCDVELYLKRIDWFDKLLIEGRITAHEGDQKSWRSLIKIMNADGRPIPRAYKHPFELSKMFGQVIKPNAEAYFRDRGYIR